MFQVVQGITSMFCNEFRISSSTTSKSEIATPICTLSQYRYELRLQDPKANMVQRSVISSVWIQDLLLNQYDVRICWRIDMSLGSVQRLEQEWDPNKIQLHYRFWIIFTTNMGQESILNSVQDHLYDSFRLRIYTRTNMGPDSNSFYGTFWI